MTRRVSPSRMLVGALFVVAVVGVAFYVSGYLGLTLAGRFEPRTIGFNGVKAYQWAPKGFVTEFRWNSEMERKYRPLYFLDQVFWHTTDDADGGKYPVNKVDVENISEVYRAWMTQVE